MINKRTVDEPGKNLKIDDHLPVKLQLEYFSPLLIQMG